MTSVGMARFHFMFTFLQLTSYSTALLLHRVSFEHRRFHARDVTATVLAYMHTRAQEASAFDLECMK